MRAFVDTNVFVRLLTGDDAAKAERCADLFEQVEQGTTALFTSEAIIAEVVYVLTSKDLYAHTRVQTAQALRPLIE
jgi:predicted nucleic acid-binding protein